MSVRACHRALLAGIALGIAWLAAHPQGVLAQSCSTAGTTSTTVTVTCDAPGQTITTNNNEFPSVPSPATNAVQYSFPNANLIADITAGTTLAGDGHFLSAGVGKTLDFNNSGAISGGPVGATSAVVEVRANGGLLTYTGNGSITKPPGNFGAALALMNSGSGGVNVGSLATPIAPNISGEYFAGINIVTDNGNQNVFIGGGSLEVSTGTWGLLLGTSSASSAANINVALTGGTTFVSAPGAGPGLAVSATARSGNVTVSSDANIGTLANPLAVGIEARSDTGLVRVDLTGGTIRAFQGISAQSPGAVLVGTAVGSAINVAGNGTGIFASPGDGHLVTVNGTITGGGIGIAVSPINRTGGTVAIGGAVTGAQLGLQYGDSNNPGGFGNTIVVSGTLSGTIGMQVTAGSHSLENTGTITGTGGTAIRIVTPTGNLLGPTFLTLRDGNGTINGNIDLVNFAFLTLGYTQDHTLPNVITGDGLLLHNNAGVTTTLTGASTHFGAINVGGGTIKAGGVNVFSPNARFNIFNDGTVDLDGFNQSVLGIGNEGEVKLGSATLTLINGDNGGVFSGTGAVVVNSSLEVTGTIAPTILTTINNDASLAGTGSVGSVIVASGGTLAPGSFFTPGTLTVNGNLNLNAGSRFEVLTSATTAGSVIVTGTATLAGDVVITPVQRLGTAQRFRIVDAASLNGVFTGVTVNGIFGTGNFVTNPTLAYDVANGDVYLDIGPGLLTPLLPAGANPNVTAVAGGIDRALAANVPLPFAFNILFLQTGPALTNALTQLSNQQAASVPQAGFQAMGSFLSLLLNPFSDNRNGSFGPALPYAPQQQASLPREVADAYAAVMPAKASPITPGRGLSLWASAYGGSGTVDGDAFAGTNKTTSRVYGFAAGLDHRISPNSSIGFALAGGATNWSVSNGLGGGNSEYIQAGLYGSHRFAGSAYVSAAGAFAWHQISTSRTVFVGPEALAADFNANSFGARLESGYRFAMQTFGLTPYAALQAQSFMMPGYRERATFGPGVFALTENANTTSNVRTELGLWADHAIVVKHDGLLTLRARAAWVHDSNTDRSASAVFQTLPGSNFTVNGARPSKDGALVSGVAEYRAGRHWALLAKFDGEFSGTTTTYAGTGTARYTW